MAEEKHRCSWAIGDWLTPYHDTEWGVPVFDDRKMFEFLVLDGFQAGLSWEIILKKRDGFKAAFLNYEPEKVAALGPEDEARLRQDASIIRNKAKIRATITNAQKVLDLWAAGKSLADLMWDFMDGRTLQNTWQGDGDIPAKTDVSEKMSKELKARGFKFVGPTIVYAVMQSAGLVNDHLVSCFRYQDIHDYKG